MTLMPLISLPFLPRNLHTPYSSNQNIYRTKWFTILEKYILGNLKLFWTKRFLFSTVNTVGSNIMCGDNMSERSKK